MPAKDKAEHHGTGQQPSQVCESAKERCQARHQRRHNSEYCPGTATPYKYQQVCMSGGFCYIVIRYDMVAQCSTEQLRASSIIDRL